MQCSAQILSVGFDEFESCKTNILVKIYNISITLEASLLSPIAQCSTQSKDLSWFLDTVDYSPVLQLYAKQTIQYVLVRLVHVSWVSSESGLDLQVGVSVWIHHSVLFFGSPVNGYLSSVVRFWQLKKGTMNILAHILWKDAFIDLGWIPGMELRGAVGSMAHFIKKWLAGFPKVHNGP